MPSIDKVQAFLFRRNIFVDVSLIDVFQKTVALLFIILLMVLIAAGKNSSNDQPGNP
jgi:hypothetical protein